MSNSRETNEGRRRPKRNFQDAVDRLERAIEDLVDSSSEEAVDRTTEYVNRARERVDQARRGRRREAEAPGDDPGRGRYRQTESSDDDAGRSRRWDWPGISRRTRSLYRDPEHGMIGGVCAGIARYLGIETWVVRCAVVTALIVLHHLMLVIFIAYWVAYFIMDPLPGSRRHRRRRRRRHRGHSHRRARHRSRRSDRYAEDASMQDEAVEDEFMEDEDVEEDDRAAEPSPSAPGLGPHWSPRTTLRYLQSDFDEFELRLRRMEQHVTSGRYELQRELREMEAGGS